MSIEFDRDDEELQLVKLFKAFCNCQILDRSTLVNNSTSFES
jgi:hypothetical protein